MRDEAYLKDLIEHLRKFPNETDWLEFKTNYFDPEDIGQYISALSNAATLNNVQYGYLIFGIDNDTHEIVGTNIILQNKKKGNEELESWLTRLLNPKIQFDFYDLEINDSKVAIIEIKRAEYTIIKNDDKVKSILSYVISICAIIFLLDKSSSIRLKYICAQSIIIWAITVCVAFIPIIQFFGWIFSAIFVIWGIVQVAGDEPYPTLPVIGNLAESIFGAIIHRKPEIVAKPKPQPTKVPGTESQQAQQTQQTQQVVQQPAQSVPPVQPNNNNTQQ